MALSKSLAAIASLLALVQAHMIMNTPAPYALVGTTLNNSPLDANGDNFPCKLGSGISFDTSTPSTSMALGSSQPLSFTGSAVHGGGSCQISITYDTNINSQTTWKVIRSIEGGCPATGQTGNFPTDSASYVDPDQYTFNIPSDIPTGNVTLAWTWFNKIGNREMYMNCAPVTLTGTSGSQSNFDALPDMFVANVGNGCGTLENYDVSFPNPGNDVTSMNGATTAFTTPTGSCQTAVAASGSAIATASAAATTSAAAAATSAKASRSTTSTIAGGVFITVANSPSASISASTVAAVTKTSAAAVTTGSSATTAATAQASSGTSGAGSGSSSTTTGALSGACSTEGEWNCIGGTSYQQCASGTWSTVMPLAAGTSCTAGTSSALVLAATNGKVRRIAARFSA